MVCQMSRKPEENELNMLQQKFESAQWTTIEGCNRDRWYIPDMKGCDPQFHKLAANITDHVKQMVLHLHPRHIYITYSALKSAPLNSRQAYHTDYALDVHPNTAVDHDPFPGFMVINFSAITR